MKNIRIDLRSVTIVSTWCIVYAVLLFTLFRAALSNFSLLYIGTEGDGFGSLWYSEWFKNNFFRSADALHITNVFYPIGIDVRAGWETSIIIYLGSLWNILFGLIPSYNLLVILPFILNFITAYWYFNLKSKNLIFSGLCSVLFCFNAFFIARSLGHLSFIRFYPFPILFFLLERKTFEKVELKYDLLLIGAYALISIISWYYFTFAIFITAIYLIFKLIPLSKISIDKIKTIILIYVPALFVVILVNYPMFEAFAFGSKYFRPYPFRMDNKELNFALSMDWIDYIRPFSMNNFWAQYHVVSGNIEKAFFPGTAFFIFLLIAVYIWGKHKNRIKVSWSPIVITLTFFLLSQGVKSPIPIYHIIRKLPLFSIAHAPSRYAIISIFLLWLFIVIMIGKYMRSRILLMFIALVSIFALYEVSCYSLPVTSFKPEEILKSIPHSNTPIVEIPIKFGNPNSLIIPAVADRPVFGGAPIHTTYSPSLLNIIENNAFDALKDKQETDIFPYLTVVDFLNYIKMKYHVEYVVLNKNQPITEKEKLLLSYLTLVNENEKYIIYRVPNNTIKQNTFFIVSGIGINQQDYNATSASRSFEKNTEIDLINLSNLSIKVACSIKIERPNLSYRYQISLGNQTNLSSLELTPGANVLKITSDKQCVIEGQKCIVGRISSINCKQK